LVERPGLLAKFDGHDAGTGGAVDTVPDEDLVAGEVVADANGAGAEEVVDRGGEVGSCGGSGRGR
jgi:hypothetical protein